MREFSYVRGKKQSYDHPAHKRRFPRYASRNGINFEDYLTKKTLSEINVLSPASDITFWKRQKIKNSIKIVFDANDPFLMVNNFSVKDKLRGLFKYLSGNHKYLDFNYRKSYLELCNIADLVVVGHKSQYDFLQNKSKKVCLIPDYGLDIQIRNKKNFNLSENKTINIFWEGLGSSFLPFKLIEKIFEPINDKYNFLFHFVTDLSFYKYGDQFVKKNIIEVSKNISPKFYKQFRFYQFSEYMMNKIAIACDFGIIPLPIDNSLNYWKPENKLIHMWRMCLPVITSKIPSYDMVMKDTNQDLCTNDYDKWRDLVLAFSNSESLRKKSGLIGYNHVNKFYSNSKIDLLWETNFLEI